MSTYMGLAVPLYGESQITGTTAANDILTITGATSHTGDFLVCETSAGVEKLVVEVDGDILTAGAIKRMVIGTVALATLASNASATVALSGITTGYVIAGFDRAAVNEPMPVLFASAADKIGYAAPGVQTSARTINVWAFATA